MGKAQSRQRASKKKKKSSSLVDAAETGSHQVSSSTTALEHQASSSTTGPEHQASWSTSVPGHQTTPPTTRQKTSSSAHTILPSKWTCEPIGTCSLSLLDILFFHKQLFFQNLPELLIFLAKIGPKVA